MLSCAIFFEIGILYKKYKYKIELTYKYFFVSIAFLCIYLHFEPKGFSIDANSYNNVFGLIICGICGFYLTFYISKFIMKNTLLTKIFSYIGAKTLVILCFHLLCFKLIVLLQLYLYNQPKYMLASFPTMISENGWWIIYTLIGIGGPLFLQFIYENIKNFILKNRCKQTVSMTE